MRGLKPSAFREGNFENLQRLGRVLHVTPSCSVIVKVENLPRIGQTVVDENLRALGRVTDIIGSVSSPYAAIRPTSSEVGKLTGATLYAVPAKRRKEKSVNERSWRRAKGF